MIPFLKVNMPSSACKSVCKVMKSGFVADGENVKEFENLLGEFIGNKNVVTVNNEVSGITLALYMAGVKPGDEVIASPMSCTASTMPVLNLFAKVKWCDINPKTGMMDPNSLEAVVTERTKAVLFTHWGGEVGEISKVNEIAHSRGLKVVEDATESFGAMLGERYLGNNTSDFTILSFGPVKHITTIDGGAILFNSENNCQKARDLKRFGINRATFRDELGEIIPTADIPLAGYNFYMNNVCASIGTEQLKNTGQILEKYYDNGNYYKVSMNDIKGLTMLARKPENKSSFWVFTLLAENRDELLKALRSRGVGASKLHCRNDVYSCYGTGLQKNLSGVNEFSVHELSIPCGWWVTNKIREEIVNAVKAGW